MFGMSQDDYALLVTEQEGRCAICRRMTKLCVDHDHACCPRGGGKTCGKCRRGLLCDFCNRGLGMFRDNPEVLRNAAAYLDRWVASLPPLELFSTEEAA
jgi:hypothetical protein